MLKTLLLIVEDAENDLLSGYTDHDSYVAANAIQALANAVRRAIAIEAQRAVTTEIGTVRSTKARAEGIAQPTPVSDPISNKGER